MIPTAQEWMQKNRGSLLRLLEFFLVAVIFFGLGSLYKEHNAYIKQPMTIVEPKAEYAPVVSAEQATSSAPALPATLLQTTTTKGQYVASRSGTAYYLVTCSNQIKDANKIFFNTKEDAEKAGFSPAQSCFK